MSENRVRIFGVNGRVNFMGGQRITPVDEERTLEIREVVYDETRAFSRQEPMVISADLTLEYRTKRRNISSVRSLQLFNVTGYQEFYGYRYNLREERIEEDREQLWLSGGEVFEIFSIVFHFACSFTPGLNDIPRQ